MDSIRLAETELLVQAYPFIKRHCYYYFFPPQF